MSIFSLIGLLILIVGVFLIGFGVRATQTVTNKVVQGFTGRYTRNTMWYLIGGALLIIVGGILIYSGWHAPILPR
ncbi:DUF3185 family protein [Candidatus Protochlamydia phocaeensis]|uniref:DUF3185 family protein n=1 Tax=Candidatus Protochlamydia phocaeensis TaxID=1414722 RepID=UPI000838D30D|nr:DUF3185 family protein [Candidatus Protochlamydia phocaeensis]